MSSATHTINVPLCVPVTKKKKFYLNLNQYRNAHHFTLSKAKINFHDIVAPLLKGLPKFKTIHLIFTHFPGSEQLSDTSNVCSIVDKFFSDVLVSCEKIEDDNRNIVLSALYRYGGVDRTNPRCEVSITPGDVCTGSVRADSNPFNLEESKEPNMQITIVQADIEEAIRNYITSQIQVRQGMRIDIDLRATRGPEGYQAIIDIVPESRPSTAVATGSTGVAQAVEAARAVPKANRPTSVTKAAEAETASNEEAPAGNTDSRSGSTDTGNTAETAQDAPETDAESPDSTPASEDAGTGRKSLFGDLKKPVNA